MEDPPGHFSAPLTCRDQKGVWKGHGRSFCDAVLPVLGEAQEEASRESVPRSLPIDVATQFAHVGLPVHQGRVGPAAESAWGTLWLNWSVLPGTREVGGLAETVALTTRVGAFPLSWEKDAPSDMSRKVKAEAQKLAQGKDVAWESSTKKIVPGPGEVVPGPPPPKGAERGCACAGCHSGWANVGAAVAAVGGWGAQVDGEAVGGPSGGPRHTAGCCALREQRAKELLKERDGQLLVKSAAPNKSESGWPTSERKLLHELQTVHGPLGMKRTVPELVQDSGVLDDKA